MASICWKAPRATCSTARHRRKRLSAVEGSAGRDSVSRDLSRLVLIAPEPHGQDPGAATNLREQRACQTAVRSAVEVSGIEQGVAHREPRIVLGSNSHQPARQVHGVPGRRYVLVAAAETRGDDRAEMRADLEAELI